MTSKLNNITVWMLKDINTNSFLAISTQDSPYPYWLCPYFEICEGKMVVGEYRLNIEHIAKKWNKAHRQHKVKPIKVRVSLEFLNKGE